VDNASSKKVYLGESIMRPATARKVYTTTEGVGLSGLRHPPSWN